MNAEQRRPYEHRIVVTKSVNQQRFHYHDAVGFIDLGPPGWGSAEESYTWQKRSPHEAYPARAVSVDEIRRLLE